jgi:hypothetical protein
MALPIEALEILDLLKDNCCIRVGHGRGCALVVAIGIAAGTYLGLMLSC